MKHWGLLQDAEGKAGRNESVSGWQTDSKTDKYAKILAAGAWHKCPEHAIMLEQFLKIMP